MRWKLLSFLGTTLGRVVAPPKCGACDERLHAEALLCGSCAGTVERWTGEGEPFAFGLYGGALASVLLRIKYAERPDLATSVGLLLAQHLASDAAARGKIDVVVPVPVPRSRLVERGFNQAALIARPVACALGAAFAPLALERAEGGARQASLTRAQRLENLHDDYRLRTARGLRDRSILIVDDVSTTGATLSACRSAIALADPRSVVCAAVARVEKALDGSAVRV